MTEIAWSSRERERRSLQERFDASRASAERNRAGQFATPPRLALELASLARELVGDRARLRFLEPALGSGAFYSALRHVFGGARIAQAVGVERDPVLARAARALWAGTGLELIQGDFMQCAAPPPERRFDLILTNPPYVRHHHLSLEYKRGLKSSLALMGRSISGLASLYAYFVLAADAWLAEGGVAIWLLPHELLDVNYGASLREYLAHEVELLRVHRYPLEGLQFSDALVTSCVVAYAKRPAGRTARFSSGAGIATPSDRPEGQPAPEGTCAPADVTIEVPIASLRGEARWSRFFSPPEGARLAHTGVAPPRLGELFSVRRGIATGANGFFILPRAEARARGLPDEFLRPILPSPRSLATNVIERSEDGHPALADSLVVLDCTLEEREVRRRWPALAAYLDAGVEQGIHLRYLPRHRSPWYAQERRAAAPFLCTYMGRATDDRARRPFRFFLNRSDATAPNVYLMLYPKSGLQASLSADPSLYARLHRCLEDISFRAFAAHGRVYGGGLYKLEPRELAALPVEGFPEPSGPRQEA